jgi:hypothetical protein
MKKNVFLTLILLTNFYVFSQDTTSINSKYLTSLIYLKTNSEINQQIKKFQENWLKKEKLGKYENVDFNISKYITYLPIPYIEVALNDNYLQIDNKSHREKYYFDLEEIEIFKDLIPNRQSKIYLLFSKPFDNYLVAEFVINSTNIEIDMVDHKKGPAMHLLFIFDEMGIVKRVYTSYSYYN